VPAGLAGTSACVEPLAHRNEHRLGPCLATTWVQVVRQGRSMRDTGIQLTTF
jgi:hypothetical protein